MALIRAVEKSDLVDAADAREPQPFDGGERRTIDDPQSASVYQTLAPSAELGTADEQVIRANLDPRSGSRVEVLAGREAES